MPNTVTPILPTSMQLGEIVEEVWSSFLDGELVAAAAPDDQAPEGADSGPGDAAQIAAWVAISGTWTGHLMVVAGPVCAARIAGSMFEMDGDDASTAEIADALGEIANMVGGSVKGMIGVPAVLSLPQVVLDASALVSPEASKVVSVYAQWKGEPLEFSLWQRDAAAADVGEGRSDRGHLEGGRSTGYLVDGSNRGGV